MVMLGWQQKLTSVLVLVPPAVAVGTRKPLSYSALLALGRVNLYWLFLLVPSRKTLLDYLTVVYVRLPTRLLPQEPFPTRPTRLDVIRLLTILRVARNRLVSKGRLMVIFRVSTIRLIALRILESIIIPFPSLGV